GSGTRVRLALYLGLLAALAAALTVRLRWQREARAREHDLLGMSYYKQGKLDAAAVELRREVAIAPERALAYYKLGIMELQQRRPKDGRLLSSLGTIYLYRASTPDNNQAALAVLRQATALRDAPAGAYYSLGRTYRRAGRWSEAAAALEEALKRDPQMLEARHALGSVYRRLGQESRASEQFR